MAYRRLPVLVVSGALLGCAAAPPELRLPAEIAAPSPDDWRQAAGELADGIAAAPDLSEPAILDPVVGAAPPYFRDFLLEAFVTRSVKVAESGDTPLHIACRTTPIGVLPPTRGLAAAPASLPAGEISVLCLLARDGTYVAAARHALAVPARPPAPEDGVVIEVKG